MANDRILRGRLAKKNLTLAKRLAEECSKVLENTGGNLSMAETELQRIIDNNLGNVEYIILMNDAMKAVLHSHPFGKNLIYKDDTAKNAASASQPLAQLVQRKSNELLLETSAPINLKGRHQYTLRLGYPVVQAHLLTRIIIPAVVITLVPGAVAYTVTRSPIILSATIVATILIALWMAWIFRYIMKGIEPALINAKMTNRGDFTNVLQPTTNDELGQFTFEINKTIMGVKNVVYNNVDGMNKVATATNTQLDITREVSRATEQIAATMEQLAAGAKQQDESTSESTSQADEISHAMQRMVGTMAQTVQLAQDAVDAAQKGMLAVERSIEQMGTISQAMELSSHKVNELEERSQQIKEIIGVITGIADQTNLLALNAAIEAARAGEHGRGFAVVAEEVRKLSEESSASAQQIMNVIFETNRKTGEVGHLIQQVSKEAQIGHQVVNETGDAIRKSMDAVRMATEHVKENTALLDELNYKAVSLAEHQQTLMRISQETAAAVETVSSAAEEQAAMTQETASKAEELHKTATDLMEYLKPFKF